MKNKFILSAVLTLLTATLSNADWPDPFCPYPSNQIINYPHFGDCSSYWQCFEGSKYIQYCQDGTEFSAALQQCAASEVANCDPFAPTGANTRPPTTERTGPDCSLTGEAYLPFAGDCTKYWECSGGNGYLYTCPPGLWWHQEMSICDYPGEFCNNGTVTEGPTTTLQGQPHCENSGPDPVYYPYIGDCNKYWECTSGDVYLNYCPGGLWWDESRNVCDYPGEFCSFTGPTPTYTTPHGPPTCGNNSEDHFYPDYEDCNKYWECTNGNLLINKCPEGLWFNPNSGQCDYPDGDFCRNGSVTIGPMTTLKGQPDCKDTGPDPVYYSFIGDCTKYWECTNGRVYLNYCPDNLWWNEFRNVCDDPGDFCTFTTQASHTTPHGPPNCQGTIGDHYYPDYEDCSKYWECSNGNLLWNDCQKGLWWHQSTEQCDYPGEFCYNASVIFTPPTTISGLPNCKGTGQDPVYHPYIGDCTKYWECANEILYEYVCPNGLWWHQDEKICDYKDSDVCDSF